jgi:ketosteroid isomerase-like protein
VPGDPTDLLTTALRAVLLGEAVDVVALFTEDLATWSPTIATTSRAELVEALAAVDDLGDALSDVVLSIDSLVVVADVGVIAEWRLGADHTGPLLIGDDLLVEASGRRIELAGASFAELRGSRIRALRTYFDDAALIEQLTLV